MLALSTPVVHLVAALAETEPAVLAQTPVVLLVGSLIQSALVLFVFQPLAAVVVQAAGMALGSSCCYSTYDPSNQQSPKHTPDVHGVAAQPP